MSEDRWVNDELKIGCIVYDEEAKEKVKISNGKCILDHSSPAAYASDHAEGGGCLLEPHEAVAIRPLGFEKGGKLVLAWTYRQVKTNYLGVCPGNTTEFVAMLEVASGEKDSEVVIGVGRV